MKKEIELCKSRLVEAGCSKEVVEEIWKWYDPTDKRGVASF